MYILAACCYAQRGSSRVCLAIVNLLCGVVKTCNAIGVSIGPRDLLLGPIYDLISSCIDVKHDSSPEMYILAPV